MKLTSNHHQLVFGISTVVAFFFFLMLLFICLFCFWLRWVFVATQAFSLGVANGGFSLVALHGLLIVLASLVAEHRLQGTWASVVAAHRLQSVGSVVVAHGLSCSAACGIFPDEGQNPRLLHQQVNSLPLSHQRSSSLLQFINYSIHVDTRLLIFD